MKIGINNRNEIKQINNITDLTLTKITLPEDNPFENWSNERILCYCYKQTENGVSIYPYVNTDKITEIEQSTLELQSQVIELEFEKILGGYVDEFYI